jgi:hypothetical protein
MAQAGLYRTSARQEKAYIPGGKFLNTVVTNEETAGGCSPPINKASEQNCATLEIASVLVRFDRVARLIVNANHSVM